MCYKGLIKCWQGCYQKLVFDTLFERPGRARLGGSGLSLLYSESAEVAGQSRAI